jgi:glucose-1-phosphatase
MEGIKNIIFDLGGVLLNIDFNKSIEAFKKLGIENFDEMFSQVHADSLFKKLETGNVDEAEFYSEIKKRTRVHITDSDIAAAWNALILDFRIESLNFIESLSVKYKLFLLSNTNSIHHAYFQKLLTKETGRPSLDGYFTRAWYSQELGLRKPGEAIYEFVLQDGGLVAAETLFIDDTIPNIETAKKLGFKTHHLKPNEKIENIRY